MLPQTVYTKAMVRYCTKSTCPAGVYGDVISDEEESRTVQVFQDETSFAYTLASEMKDGKTLKEHSALAPDIESVRPIFATTVTPQELEKA